MQRRGFMMIDTVTIQSMDGEGRLVLSDAERNNQDQPDYAIATVVLTGVIARTRISLHQSTALINLFEDLSAAEHGWKGEKYAETLEGELKFKCTRDNHGQLALERVSRRGWKRSIDF